MAFIAILFAITSLPGQTARQSEPVSPSEEQIEHYDNIPLVSARRSGIGRVDSEGEPGSYLETGERLVRGDSGRKVRQLQEDLKTLAKRYDEIADPGEVNGVFGPMTQASTASVQGWAGLPVNTVVNQPTKQAIRRALSLDHAPVTGIAPLTREIVLGGSIVVVIAGLSVAMVGRRRKVRRPHQIR